MSHPFGNLVTQFLHRKHGLSQAKLAAGILQEPSIVSKMCRGQRLTGAQARERVLAIIGWLCEQGALDSRAEADALLSAAGLAPLRESIELDALALRRLSPPSSAPRRAHGERAVIACEFPLIGRDNELATLLGAWRTLSKSGARFVCIAGEAGIGKTRLAEELLIAAQRESCLIARARAYSFETPLPYQPVSDWLRSPDVYDRVRAQPAALRTELARLVPELLAEDASLAAPGPLSDGWRRRQFLDALVQPFTLDAPPALLVLDDLQWCDGETLEFLQLLMRSAKQRPLLIVGTLRPAELDASHRVHGMLHQLLRDDQLIQVVLGALDQDACAELSGLAAKRSLDESAAVRLFRDSAGNPLFVIEGARDTQELPGGANRDTPTALPPRLHALLAQRLRRLSAQALSIVEIASVIGRAFSAELLASAAGQDVATTNLALDELWQRRLLREDAVARFDIAHDRIRDVIYAEISAPRLRMLHRHAAQALELGASMGAAPANGELGEHWLRAGVPEKAFSAFWGAAQHARKLMAHTDVVRLLERALHAASLDADNRTLQTHTIEVWRELGYARVLTHYWGSAEVREAWSQEQRAAQRYGTLAQQTNALDSMAVVSCNAGNWRESCVWSERSLPMAEESADPALIASTQGRYGTCLYHFGEFQRAQVYLERHHAFFNTDAPSSREFMLGNQPRRSLIRNAKNLWMLGHLTQARSELLEALEIAREYPETGFGNLDFGGMLSIFLRDETLLQVICEELVPRAEKYDYHYYRLAGQMYRGWLELQKGNDQQGLQSIRASADGHRERGARMHEPFWRSLLAHALTATGAVDEAISEVDAVLRYAEETGNRYWSAHLLRQRGDLALQRGESGQEAWYCQAIELARAQGGKSLELRAATALARTWRDQRRFAEARELLLSIYEWFTEGFDTSDLRDAAALLAVCATATARNASDRRQEPGAG